MNIFRGRFKVPDPKSPSRQDALMKWMTERVVTSDIVGHYFDLKRANRVDAHDVEAIFVIIQKLMLGSCGFFSSVIARQIGQDHLVWFFAEETERLLHSVIACSPQYERGALRGAYVDVVGRGNFRELLVAMEEVAGPVTVEIGGPIDPSDFLEGEEAALMTLAKALPWTRQFMGISKDESEKIDAFAAMMAVGEFRRDGEEIHTAASFSHQ